MCTKTEERILIASKPFIKKTPARKLVCCSQEEITRIWNTVTKKYEKEFGSVPVFGLPTSYFLNEVHLTLESLEKLNENEKRFNG